MKGVLPHTGSSKTCRAITRGEMYTSWARFTWNARSRIAFSRAGLASSTATRTSRSESGTASPRTWDPKSFSAMSRDPRRSRTAPANSWRAAA